MILQSYLWLHVMIFSSSGSHEQEACHEGVSPFHARFCWSLYSGAAPLACIVSFQISERFNLIALLPSSLSLSMPQHNNWDANHDTFLKSILWSEFTSDYFFFEFWCDKHWLNIVSSSSLPFKQCLREHGWMMCLFIRHFLCLFHFEGKRDNFRSLAASQLHPFLSDLSVSLCLWWSRMCHIGSFLVLHLFPELRILTWFNVI